MVGRLALAAVPIVLSVLLIRYAASDDSYTNDGQSYWSRHPAGQVILVAALLVNLLAAALIYATGRERLRSWVWAAAVVTSVMFSALAYIAISAN
jgi:hypothetical protein